MDWKVDTKELRKLTFNLEEAAKHIEEDAMKLCREDAEELKEQLIQEYYNAVNKTYFSAWRMPNNNKYSKRYTGADETIGFTTTLSRLGEAKGVKGYVSPAIGGFYVTLSGPDVAFVEYGTGTEGSEDPHPELPPSWGYNTGAMISLGKGKDTPGWRRAIDRKASPGDYNELKKGKPLWIYNGIVRDGMPASMFMYHAVEWYKDKYQHRDSKFHMSSKGLTNLISKRINEK